MKYIKLIALISFMLNASCESNEVALDPEFNYTTYQNSLSGRTISRADYHDKLKGFWLGACIANWTGLVTEMDKVGNIGEFKTGDFYTRNDWGKADQPSIWSAAPSELSPTIDFVLRGKDEVWGADDDTDIEYMYQYLLYKNKTSFLTPKQIQEGWLKHIKPEEENFLWVSNQKAFDLMKEGLLPPATGDSINNEHYEMIDAQLTTEIFGLFAPGMPEIALKMANLPIRTSADKEAVEISEFYVRMYAMAANIDKNSIQEQLMARAKLARSFMNDMAYPAAMFDYVKALYDSGQPWEKTRDDIYKRYQVEQADGYNITAQNLYCNGCFAAGINYAASLVSLFYGEGDYKKTIQIGSLCGWDSDNPTATWGGLLGFIYGHRVLSIAFDQELSESFNIHRTRQNFPDNGEDNFDRMANEGLFIIDRLILTELSGGIDRIENLWFIPEKHFAY